MNARVAFVALALVSCLAACATPSRESAKTESFTGEWIVRADGVIGSGAHAFAIDPETLRTRVMKLASEKRPRAIDRLVAKHSDAARTLLLDTRAGGAEFADVAAAYERVSAVSDAAWSARARAAGTATALDGEIAARRDALARGEATTVFQAAAVDSSTRVQVDELARLDGIRSLLTGDFKGAAKSLDAAQRRTSALDRESSAEFALLASSAFARAGDEASAARAWTDAVTLIGQLALEPVPVRAATLLERAVSLRTPKTSWPDSVLRAAEAASARVIGADARFADRASDAAALGLLAAFRLDRGQPDAALLAYARAGAAANDARLQAQLRIGQAKALAKSRRAEEAQGLLASMAGQSDEAVTRPALTLLAALELARGRVERAEGLLTHLIANAEAEHDWPSRWSARANLAGIRVARGDTAQAVQLLDAARADAVALKDSEAIDAIDAQRATIAPR